MVKPVVSNLIFPCRCGLMIAVVFCLGAPAIAQVQSAGYYQPLNQSSRPGKVGEWAAMAGQIDPSYYQPVRFQLPSEGTVSVYSGPRRQPLPAKSPAQFGLSVGRFYRLKLAGMPEFPGVELYPSVEIFDRLHPPAGKEEDYPVPVHFTEQELDLAVSGRMVTKVIYLEQPQTAQSIPFDANIRSTRLHPQTNLLQEADRLGRPMMIVRIGGRLPSLTGNDSEFFGHGATALSKQSATRTALAK